MLTSSQAARWLPRDFVEASQIGGVYTLLAYLMMLILFLAELTSFVAGHFNFIHMRISSAFSHSFEEAVSTRNTYGFLASARFGVDQSPEHTTVLTLDKHGSDSLQRASQPVIKFFFLESYLINMSFVILLYAVFYSYSLLCMYIV